ncbi:MAG: FtsX-like permease family protein, partial [Vicinamibacteria bacterium]
GFTGAKFLGFTPDIWIPLTMHEVVWPATPGEDRLERRSGSWLNVRGRLMPGVSVSEAAASLTTIAARLEAEYPDVNEGLGIHIMAARGKSEPIVQAEIGNAIPLAASILLGMAGLLLLVACANVASLAFARALQRRGEIRIRLSLGATRIRLIRHIALESLLVALASGICGIWLSDVLLRASLRLNPVLDFGIDYGIQTDWRVLSFTAAMTLLAALLSGLLPSLRVARGALTEGERGRSSQRLSGRRFLVIPQIAFSMVALVSAGLLVRSFQNAIAIQPGFATEGLVLASLNPELQGYDDERAKALLRSLIERIRGLPEVDSASLAFPLPLDAYTGGTRILPEGIEISADEDEGTLVFYSTVDEDYFATMETKLVEGRAFGLEDHELSRPVAIVNETLARRFWPGGSAIGKRFGAAADTPWEVVGVAEEGKYLTLGEEPRPYFYLPLGQNYDSPMTVIVRSEAPRRDVEPKLRAELRALDPALPLYGVKTGSEFLSRSLAGPRGLAVTVSVFAALALVLATVGVYGLMSFSVTQRRQELGIRMALGASRRDVLGLFLGQAARVVGSGILVGLALAVASSRVLENLLFGVDAASPAIYGGVALLLAAVALAGSYFPSRRASRLDPLKSLRHD